MSRAIFAVSRAPIDALILCGQLLIALTMLATECAAEDAVPQTATLKGDNIVAFNGIALDEGWVPAAIEKRGRSCGYIYSFGPNTRLGLNADFSHRLHFYLIPLAKQQCNGITQNG